MRNLISDYLIKNWSSIEPDSAIPRNIDIMKLDGRSDADATLNFVIFVDSEPVPSFLGKVNRSPGADRTVTAEFNNLNKIRSLVSGLKGCRAPEPVTLGSLDGDNQILIQTFLPGRKISLNNMPDLERLFSMAFDRLKLLYSASKKEVFINSAAELRNIFKEKAGSVKCEQGLSAKLVSIAEHAGGLGDMKIKISASQGDFDFDNLIIDGDTLSMTDWEDYKENSHPFLDAEFFIFNAALYFYEDAGHLASFDRFFAGSTRTRQLADRYIAEYCDFLGVPKPVFYIFAIMDTAEILRSGYGKHAMVPMQNMGFLEKLTDLTIREIENGNL